MSKNLQQELKELKLMSINAELVLQRKGKEIAIKYIKSLFLLNIRSYLFLPLNIDSRFPLVTFASYVSGNLSDNS